MNKTRRRVASRLTTLLPSLVYLTAMATEGKSRSELKRRKNPYLLRASHSGVGGLANSTCIPTLSYSLTTCREQSELMFIMILCSFTQIIIVCHRPYSEHLNTYHGTKNMIVLKLHWYKAIKKVRVHNTQNYVYSDLLQHGYSS